MVTKLCFAHNVTVCNSVTVEFWVTLEFLQNHGNLKPKHFDFCIKNKPVDWACQFRYHWLDIFVLLEIDIESSVAFFVYVEVLRPCQQLRSCRAGQLPNNTIPGQA